MLPRDEAICRSEGPATKYNEVVEEKEKWALARPAQGDKVRQSVTREGYVGKKGCVQSGEPKRKYSPTMMWRATET